MSLHNVYDALRRGFFPSGLAADPQNGPVANAVAQFFPTSAAADKRTNYMLAYGDAVPSAVAGYAVGCVFFQINPAANTQSILVNTGTATSCTFTKVQNIDTAIAVSQTLATGKTLTVTDADKLLVGGVIVPQFVHLTFHIPKIAADVLYNAFVAPRAMTVTRIDYVPRIAQGGAMTVTPVKATGVNAPAAATTPLVSAAFDGNATADTVQNGALTATGADLVLAAGNRIGVVLSTASTVGQSDLTFTLKYS